MYGMQTSSMNPSVGFVFIEAAGEDAQIAAPQQHAREANCHQAVGPASTRSATLKVLACVRGVECESVYTSRGDTCEGVLGEQIGATQLSHQDT
jgi:hypothetical protein